MISNFGKIMHLCIEGISVHLFFFSLPLFLKIHSSFYIEFFTKDHCKYGQKKKKQSISSKAGFIVQQCEC